MSLGRSIKLSTCSIGTRSDSTQALGWMRRSMTLQRMVWIVIRTESRLKSSGTTRTHSFDRDLNNFRLLFELRAIDAGVIITRCDQLQTIFKRLGRGHSYGASTTHMSKLLPRLGGGAGGGFPVLVF